MVKKSTTREERIMMLLYTNAKEAGDLEIDQPIEEIAKSMGVTLNSLGNSINTLAQINFIKKSGPTHIRLTANGIRLAESLLEE